MIKDYYAKFKTEYPWLIKEEGWVKELQGVREAQMALGNGFLGSRAVLEEICHDAQSGTYLAGVFDSVGSQVDELVNLPDPFNFRISIDGDKLGLVTMDVEKHKRILNLRHGLLCRHSVFQDSKSRKYDYQSIRFVSMHNKNLGLMQLVFTPLDQNAEISIETGINTSVYNASTATEGRKRHFRVKELGQFKNEGYLIVETFGKMHTVIFRSGFYYETKGKKTFAKDNIFTLKLKKSQTIVFTKIFYVDTAPGEDALDKIKSSSEYGFRKAFQAGFDSLLKKHIRRWEDLWKRAEVSIWGEPEVEKNFRFNIYHMLICAPRNNGSSSIGARALSGEGYRGHVFWDMEIFLLPFYLYTMPEVARNLLLYRYKRLDAARENARESGCKGAMFPWESAGTGKDETPGRARDLDGKVIKIHTGKREHHISADIAYAFYHYYNITGDEPFLRNYGSEVIFETARFWASRVEYNKKKKFYEIKSVIGPDEFHEEVNNNAFTNMMAKWNLLTAHKLVQKLKDSSPAVYKKLTKQLELTNREIKTWKKIASRIILNKRKGQVIEQFDGYFKKRRVKITEWDEDYLPVAPAGLTPRDYSKTQLVKQADVVMLLYLLSDFFNPKTKKQNYDYYVERTLHKSSLSLPIYAVMAIEAGDRNRAYRFFNTALRTDISDLHRNTSRGIHAACMGGTWQVLINGFAGVRIDKEVLSINPRLPKGWRKVLFSIHWREFLFKLEIKNEEIKIHLLGPKKRKIKIKVFDILQELSADRIFKFERKEPKKEAKAYYF